MMQWLLRRLAYYRGPSDDRGSGVYDIHKYHHIDEETVKRVKAQLELRQLERRNNELEALRSDAQESS